MNTIGTIISFVSHSSVVLSVLSLIVTYFAKGSHRTRKFKVKISSGLTEVNLNVQGVDDPKMTAAISKVLHKDGALESGVNISASSSDMDPSRF